MKIKIITCAGYYGTGSSAITDLLGEFDCVYYMGDFEFRFVQDPGGIADLDYNINENNHRHNSGHALKRFKKNIDFLAGNRYIKKYERFFDGRFKKISYEYIRKLTLLQYKGYWHQDVIDRGYWFYVLERLLEKSFNKFIVPIIYGGKKKDALSIHLLRNEMTYVPIFDPDKFYELTKEYMNKLFSVANKQQKEFIMVDQLVPPTNISRYSRYFESLKVVAVDRDPRDLYILEKMVWHGGIVPTENVNDYCTWFENTRRHRTIEKDDKDVVLRVYLEDMVYHYEKTLNDILKFLNIDNKSHFRPFTTFIPEQSKKNTRLWEKYPELDSDIKYIENKLSEFCYKNY